jgi:hypothetical protein
MLGNIVAPHDLTSSALVHNTLNIFTPKPPRLFILGGLGAAEETIGA